MKIRVISLLLAIMTVLSVAVACSPGNDPTPLDSKADDLSDTETASSDESSTVNEEETLNIPSESFNGYKFTILCPGEEDYGNNIADFTEPSANAVQNAFYLRSCAVEELLGVDIVSVEISAIYGDITIKKLFETSISAQTEDYNITFDVVKNAIQSVASGYCLPIDELEYIDLDKSWWNRDCTDQLSIGGNHYMVSGDIAISDKECLWMVAFNGNIIRQLGLENPYELVYNNEWTQDKMVEMSAKATFDYNGDGKISTRPNTQDYIGFTSHGENIAAGWQSAGVKMVEKDENDMPYFAWGESEFVDVYDKVMEFMNDTEKVYFTYAWDVYLDGRGLFEANIIRSLAMGMCDSDFEVGVVPYPKFSSDLDRYYTYVAEHSCVMIVANNCKDLYETGVITEALAYYGKEYITPTYFTRQLKSRYATTEDFAYMLDIIFTQRCYDIGVFGNFGGAFKVITMRDMNVTRTYAQFSASQQTALDQMFEKLQLE